VLENTGKGPRGEHAEGLRKEEGTGVGLTCAGASGERVEDAFVDVDGVCGLPDVEDGSADAEGDCELPCEFGPDAAKCSIIC
jgi:hypothetical protein